ncbi:putative hydroxypyruvate isomerase [Nymphon striatum]|nr:putative hydroxypyruvate isomerase [Nymphon striatum]
MEFLQNLLDLCLEAAPWLVLGLVIGGLIKALIPTSLLQKHLSGNNVPSVVKAALFGAPLPLCSCGVIPAALGLRRAGASKPATVSFLVATPETGIDSVSISYALLGPFMAIVRPIAAIVSAITAGLLVGKSEENLAVSETASTPIAAGLLLAGISPGTAMVFLMAGPATNISTLGVIGKELGKRALIAYVGGVTIVALITGFFVDYMVSTFSIDVQGQIAHSHEMVPAVIAWAALLLLIGVLSANLGFLWQELSLVEGIHAAARAGFDAVECHWPYDVHAHEVKQALEDTGLPMLSLNTLPGDKAAGDFGVCAIPGREKEARKYIEQAFNYAAEVDAKHVHVMSGKMLEKQHKSGGVLKPNLETYLNNLNYAADLAAEKNLGILIEPINRQDVPGYFLADLETAVDVVERVNKPNLKIMFDCYHIQVAQGNLMKRLSQYLEYIQHVQIAAVPSRHEPDEGEVCYSRLLTGLYESGYTGYVGAEYHPRTTTDAGLDWMNFKDKNG